MNFKISVLFIGLFILINIGNAAYYNGTYWYIYTCQDLANLSIAANATANAILANNIDCGGLYNTGTGWNPIGVSATKFSGIFDGNYYNVSNVFINRTSGAQYGLFGYTTTNAVIKNLGVINITSTYSASITEVGGLAGRTFAGIVQNCFVKDSYIGGQFAVGGLIGTVEGTTINNTYTKNTTVNTTITAGSGGSAGGLIGRYINAAGSVNNSYSSAAVIGQSDGSRDGVGGLIGYIDNVVTVHNSFYSGVITVASNPFGAFVGKNNTGRIVTFINDYYDSNTSTVNSCMRSANIALINVTGCNNQNAGTPQYFYNGSNVPLANWSTSRWGFLANDYPYLYGTNLNLVIAGPSIRISAYSTTYNNTNITYTIRSSIFNKGGDTFTGLNMTTYAGGVLINSSLVSVSAYSIVDYNITWTTTRPMLDNNISFASNITNTSVIYSYSASTDNITDILPIDPPSALGKQGYAKTMVFNSSNVGGRWFQLNFGQTVMSGTGIDNWTWRLFEHGSGRKIPNGSGILNNNWTWVNE